MTPVKVHLARPWHFRLLVTLLLALLAAAALAITQPASHADASTRSTSYWALKWAERQAGAWYCWGGTGGCYDCSGLVMEAFAHMGYSLPRTTEEMLASGRIYQIPASVRRQGDLAFFGTGHVELVTRHGTFGALDSGTRVGWHTITVWWHPTSYWRIR
jgi:cell wall-associated NlpC family hydrolase